MQRQLTHVLGYIFPQKDVTWRLNWYNEVRMPLLISDILNDTGTHSLQTRMQELVNVIQQKPDAIMH